LSATYGGQSASLPDQCIGDKVPDAFFGDFVTAFPDKIIPD